MTDRAAAVVIRDGRVLLMLRHVEGRDYAVLPGGGIEIDESPAQAAVRELAEEASLTARVVEELWAREDDGRRAFYLRMSDVTGTPRLGGPELARSGPDNRYRLYWADGSELEHLGFEPHHVIPLIRALLPPDNLRAIFDEDAALYDRARPGYPEPLFDDLVALGVIGPGRRVLEIGAGTGQATLPIARRGSSVQAVELGAALAARLQQNAAGLPIAVAVGAFEDYPAAVHSFDAVVAFTAWHWLTPDVRVHKAFEVLRPGGALATVATDHVLGGTTPFFADVQECYERWDPATPPGLRLLAADEIPPVEDEVDTSDLFEPAIRRRYTADISYSTQAYLDVLGTYSGHRALSAEQRTGLLRSIRQLIDGDYGGTVTKRYSYELRVARSRN